MTSRIALLAALAGIFASATALAQEDVSYAEELTRKVEAARAVAPLGSNLFGDETNWYTGTTTFRHVDVDIPGNNALPVRIARVASTAAEDSLVAKPFGNWDLEVPYISTLVQRPTTWSPSTRCTTPMGQPDVFSEGMTFLDSEYWRGYSISIPGTASGLMLKRDNGYVLEPTDGPDYPWVAAGNIQITCGVSIANGSGQGFLAVAPDGTRYKFDWLVTRLHSGVSKPDLNQSPVIQISIRRDEIRIYATRVEDRFGNWVNYNYNATTNRLDSIVASDGRRIDLSYNATTGQLQTVTARGQAPVGDRVWTYESLPSGLRVTQPDGKYWSIQTSKLKIEYDLGFPASNPCNLPPYFESTNQTWTLTHPSGATGSFTFTPVRHGRAVDFDLRCKYIAVDHELNPGIPTAFDTPMR